MMRWYWLCLFLMLIIFLPGLLVGQNKNKPGLELPIKKAKGIIKLDGVLDEQDWKEAAIARDFFLNYPVDSLPPTFQTEARYTFDEHFLYISFVCYDDKTPSVVQSLRRDFDPSLNDWVGISLDPYKDFTNGFYFIITPYGVQNEGTVSAGGAGMDSYNGSWDNKWYSHVVRYDDRWIAELAIPFKSFRYNSQVDHWNVSIVRNDLKRNQSSGWIATPIQFIPGSFAYSGKLVWQEPPPKAGTNVSVIPYMIASSSQDKQINEPVLNAANAGFDAKVGLTPALNLDLTVNPDFSNVEVDKQVINLTRFEFQFPERRQFFLENSDLFSAPGFGGFTQPFFSRRIGLARDSSHNLVKVPILYGARISGKLGSKWRIGLMDLQTKKKESLGLPEQNYAVAVIQRQLFSRSNLDLFLVNTQSLGLGEYDSTKYYHENLIKHVWNGTDTVKKLHLYNRVVGADFNLITKNNRWSGKAYYHQSFDDFSKDNAFSHGAFAGYTSRNINLMGGYVSLGKNFNAEAGFVPSMAVYPGNYGGLQRTDLKFYPNSKSIVLMSPGFEIDYTLLPDGTLTDKSFLLNYAISFRNTAQFNIIGKEIFQKLPSDFNVLDPKDEYTILLKGESYSWHEYNIKYSSDTRNLFTYSLSGTGGQFYNGHRTGLGGTMAYRFQPYGSASVTFDYNDIVLPPSYGSARFLLVSPRIDFTFTRALFLTTFIQYNGRYDNVNLNARFQWRFKPASDFFIVYTENYFPEQLMTKNRALVLKITYWFNL